MSRKMTPTGIPTADRTRYMREYAARRRGSVSWKSLAEDAAVLVAVAAGEVTEGRAAAVLGVDRVELRGRVNTLLTVAAGRCGVDIVLNGEAPR